MLSLKRYEKRVDAILKLCTSLATTDLTNFNTLSVDEKLVVLYNLVWQVFHLRLHPQQLLAVLLMQDGYLSEVQTGEGKSICIALNAVLEASKDRKVYVVTTNDYLSKRDYMTFTPLIEALGFTIAYNAPRAENTELDKREILSAQIIYSSCTELCFDYLLDVTEGSSLILFDSVIIDEIDYVLLDNAVSTCNLSQGQAPFNMHYLFYMTMFHSIAHSLSYTTVPFAEDVAYDLWDVDVVKFEAERKVILTDSGVKTIENLSNLSLLDAPHLMFLCTTVVESLLCYTEGIDYAIIEGKCWVMNRNNGRVSVGSTFEIDIQNAIEVKHKLDLTTPSQREESISYQVFYSKFNYIYGVSGTLMDAEKEFLDIFNLSACKVPTHKANLRNDWTSRYFRTKNEKHIHLIDLLRNKLDPWIPKLIVCEDILELKHISSLLDKEYILYNTLTSSTSDEQSVVDLAGYPSIITLSTSMVGRGTDITPHELVSSTGLLTIALCHFENMRIDAQVRGRSGRQGNHGMTLILSSMEDNLWNTCDHELREKLRTLPTKQFYTKNIQEKLDNMRIKLQHTIYSKQYTLRKSTFLMSKLIEVYREKIIKFISTKLTTEEVHHILQHKYSGFSELSDDEVMLLQIEEWLDDKLVLDYSNISQHSHMNLYAFFHDFIDTLIAYSRDRNQTVNLEAMTVRMSTYSEDLYMYYCKRYIFQFLLKGVCHEI